MTLIFFYNLFFATIKTNEILNMSSENDLLVIEEQPQIKIWGKNFDEFDDIKSFKGRFVVTSDGKLFAKLYPKAEWDNIEIFHDMIVNELGVADPKSFDVKEVIIGGGKIEIELKDDHVECHLYGKSTIYGDYEPEAVDAAALEYEIRNVFDLDEIPINVTADLEE